METLDEKVYRIVKGIPRGNVSTYKIVARKAGTRGYRAVGQALKRNAKPIKIPCHRVVRSDGGIGGYGGGSTKRIKEKISLLRSEGVKVKNNKVDIEKYGVML